MSRRRNTAGRNDGHVETLCVWCEVRPTRNSIYICDVDLDAFVAALHDLQPRSSDRVESLGGVRYAILTGEPWCPWPADEIGPLVVESEVRVEWCSWPRTAELVPSLWDDLLAHVAGERGVDYRALGGASGGSDETGIVLPERAAEIAEDVVRALRALVVVCRDARVSHIAPEGQTLKSTGLVSAMVEWLLWRVDGIALHPEAAQCALGVFEAVESARWVIDRPETRQQLGDCPVDDCDGHLTATPDSTYARCSKEGHAVEAQPLREQVRAEFDDKHMTAADIARISTYLGLRQNRDAVRKRVNQWAHRGHIAVAGYITPTAPGDDGSSVAVAPYAGPYCDDTRWCGHASCPTVRESRGVALYLFREVYDRLLAANPTDDIDDDLNTDSKGA